MVAASASRAAAVWGNGSSPGGGHAVKPGGQCLGLQPGWSDDGETVQGVAEGLTDEFQPVEARMAAGTCVESVR
jgi:hypothetical protein